MRPSSPRPLQDRANGVVAFERVIEGETRLVCVINAGRKHWGAGDYGVWVGHAEGRLEEVFNSQVRWRWGGGNGRGERSGRRGEGDGERDGEGEGVARLAERWKVGFVGG